MIKYFLIIIILFCISCSWNSASTNIGYGQPSKICPINHEKEKDNYTIKTVAIGLNNLEINISDHKYETIDNKFNNISAGIKYHFTKDISCFFIDAGFGFRLTERNNKNKWLADSYFLGDMSGSVGIKKGYFQLAYTFQHLSVPWRHDRGLNYDMIQFGATIPF